MASEHDKRYKRLFQNPYFVRKLLESFVHEDFVRHLDLSTLIRLDKSFVSEDYREKEADLIYRVEFKGIPVYIFLLVEFQSRVDKLMSIRFLRYVTDFYLSLHHKAISGKFPAVFPILVYNGERKWTAKYQISQLIEKTIPGKYIPRFRYYPVIENTIPKKSLLIIKNAMSAVFYAEQMNIKEFDREIDHLLEIVRNEDLDIAREFSSFLNNLMSSRMKHLPDDEISGKINDIGELKPMLEVKLDRYLREVEEKANKQGLEKGIAMGIAEGRIEGHAKGHAEGHAEGRAEGLTAGLAEGHAEGHIEGVAFEKKAIVSTMKNKGYSITQIAEITDIPESEILNILE
ncbi:MAG: Rpn family recombination-promoting nuclease/putative transposase [Spirochaetales bacterium]|nr:Rpn family recombination-promoting nuclease/putative transposase [Spirochaetales bacterium]